MKHILISITEDELKGMISTCIAEALQHVALSSSQKVQEDDILTIEEASGFLNLAVNPIYEKTSKKLIPFFKRDRKLYFKKSELEEWILKGKVNSIDPKDEAIVRRLPMIKSLRKVA